MENYRESAAGRIFHRVVSGHFGLERNGIALRFYISRHRSNSWDVSARAAVGRKSLARGTDNFICAGIFGFRHDGDVRRLHAGLLDLGNCILGGRIGASWETSAGGMLGCVGRDDEIFWPLPLAIAGGLQSGQRPSAASVGAIPIDTIGDSLRLPICHPVYLRLQLALSGDGLRHLLKKSHRLFKNSKRSDCARIPGWRHGHGSFSCAAMLAQTWNKNLGRRIIFGLRNFIFR